MKASTVRHSKPKSDVWLHFSVITDEQGVEKVKCNLCPEASQWQSVPNATRMAEHVQSRHKLVVRVKEEPAEQTNSPPSSSRNLALPETDSASLAAESPVSPIGQPAAETKTPSVKKLRSPRLRLTTKLFF